MQLITVTERLILVMAAPLLVLLVFLVQFMRERHAEVTQSEALAPVVELARTASTIVHEQQKERSASTGFLSSKGEAGFRDLVAKQRVLADQALKSWQPVRDAAIALPRGSLRDRLRQAQPRDLAVCCRQGRLTDGVSPHQRGPAGPPLRGSTGQEGCTVVAGRFALTTRSRHKV